MKRTLDITKDIKELNKEIKEAKNLTRNTPPLRTEERVKQEKPVKQEEKVLKQPNKQPPKPKQQPKTPPNLKKLLSQWIPNKKNSLFNDLIDQEIYLKWNFAQPVIVNNKNNEPLLDIYLNKHLNYLKSEFSKFTDYIFNNWNNFKFVYWDRFNSTIRTLKTATLNKLISQYSKQAKHQPPFKEIFKLVINRVNKLSENKYYKFESLLTDAETDLLSTEINGLLLDIFKPELLKFDGFKYWLDKQEKEKELKKFLK